MKTEMHIASLVCKPIDISQDLKKEIDSRSNIIESVYNLGNEVLKFSCKENNYYIFFYLRNFEDLAILQFNICKLINPLIGLDLIEYNGELHPSNNSIFSQKYPYINNLFFGKGELNDIIRIGKNINSNEICLNIILGLAENWNSMEQIIPIVSKMLGFIYECALEICHSSNAPSDAKNTAKDYLRALINYKHE